MACARCGQEGLPALPDFGIMLVQNPDARQPVTDALASYIAETFRTETLRDRTAA